MKNNNIEKIVFYLLSTLFIVSLIIVCVFQPKTARNIETNNETVDESNKYTYMDITTMSDSLYNISDNKVLESLSDYIAIVKIESIDGSSNINRKTKEPVISIYTYGKAKVIETIKGNLTNSIKFTRSGGEMPYDEWLRGDIDPQKIESVRKDANLDEEDTSKIIVRYKEIGDIDLEVNKTYLVYMSQSEEFNFDNEYIIIGFQYGLREVKDNKVKNNDTGKWENISNILNISKEK